VRNLYLKLILSISGVVLIATRLVWPGLKVDAITLGLVLFVALPWLFSIFERAEFPEGGQVKVRELEEKQEKQQAEISTLKFLVSHFVTDHEIRHLKSLASDAPFMFKKDSTAPFFERELRRLRALGLISNSPGKGVRSLFKKEGDVKEHFFITQQGREYLKLRQQVDAEDTVYQ
jgi:hypothetical protein